MTEVPKIVCDRLRAASPAISASGQVHPKADLLTAFAEQALLPVERNLVLEHLALCGDCREVLALALPAAEIAAPIIAEPEAEWAAAVPAKAKSSWLRFAWPNLRWAALAAGVVVAASILVMHPGKLNQPMPPQATPQVASSATTASGGPPERQPAISAEPGRARSKTQLSQMRPSRIYRARQTRPSRPETGEAGMMLASGKPANHSLADNKKESAPAGNQPAMQATGALALDTSIPRATTQTVEVAGAAPATTATPSDEISLIARNDAPAIEKAKPALPGTADQGVDTPSAAGQSAKDNVPAKTGPAAGSGLATVQNRNMVAATKLAPAAGQTLARRDLNLSWTITAGVLQRSLDSGQSWQRALRADHPLLCYATNNQDVWAGGHAGTLFRSADNGATWVQIQASLVQPSVIRSSTQSLRLTSDVIHIDVRSAVEIVLSTSNHETWSSADGGKTWVKK